MKPGRMPRSIAATEHVRQVPATVTTPRQPVKETPVAPKTTTWSISDAVIETREGRPVLIFPDGTSLLWR
jgi:1-acyl-sn-glycerol-3-phosphate acyltransferase